MANKVFYVPCLLPGYAASRSAHRLHIVKMSQIFKSLSLSRGKFIVKNLIIERDITNLRGILSTFTVQTSFLWWLSRGENAAIPRVATGATAFSLACWLSRARAALASSVTFYIYIILNNGNNESVQLTTWPDVCKSILWILQSYICGKSRFPSVALNKMTLRFEQIPVIKNQLWKIFSGL